MTQLAAQAQSEALTDHFTLTERTMGPVFLHNSMPVWIVEYSEFPEVSQPRHWQVYYGLDLKNRKPWCDNNWRLNDNRFPYRDIESAVKAALSKATELSSSVSGSRKFS